MGSIAASASPSDPSDCASTSTTLLPALCCRGNVHSGVEVRSLVLGDEGEQLRCFDRDGRRGCILREPGERASLHRNRRARLDRPLVGIEVWLFVVARIDITEPPQLGDCVLVDEVDDRFELAMLRRRWCVKVNAWVLVACENAVEAMNLLGSRAVAREDHLDEDATERCVTSGLKAASMRSSWGSDRTSCLTGTSGTTRSTRCAPVRAMEAPSSRGQLHPS
jgi:hypothetical protein